MIKIAEYATVAEFFGPKPELYDISKRLRVRVPNYWMSPAYQLHTKTGGKYGWDGYDYPLSFKKEHWLAKRGHIEAVIAAAQSAGIDIDVSTRRPSPFAGLTIDDLPENLLPGSEFELDHLQQECVVELLRHATGSIRATVSSGKCLGKGTMIMMKDGSSKPVESVVVGDRLMGPDARPRTVKSTTVGHGPLFKVIQQKGDDYVCNGDHILVLERANMRGGKKAREKSKSATGCSLAWDSVEMTVNELMRNKNTLLQYHRGVKAGASFAAVKTFFDPYFIGLWLGDGSRHAPEVTCGHADVEIKAYLENYAKTFGLKIKRSPGVGCEALRLTHGVRKLNNVVTSELRRLKLFGCVEKFIPKEYLYNSQENRLSLLAGLIDSDGSLARQTQGGDSFQVGFVEKQLAYDTLWLARSLGFRAGIHKRKTSIKSRGFVGHCYVIGIAGKCSKIPTKLARKRAGDSAKKHGLRYGIDVQPAGTGDYYGFEIDCDGRFLLEDFTVTHNTAIFWSVAAVVKRLFPNSRVLYVTPTERLVNQVFKEGRRFLPDWSVSQFGGGKRDWTGKDAVVCTAAAVHANYEELKTDGWFKTFYVLLCDECHHLTAASWVKLAESTPAFFRFGASDSLKDERPDDASKWMKIRGLTGPRRATIEAAPLIAAGRVATPWIYLIDPPGWSGKFDDLPHQAEPGTPAWTLQDQSWMKATYLGPATMLNEEGVEAQKLGHHQVQLADGREVQVESRFTLLRRAYDEAVIRHAERNQLVVTWAQHFVSRGLPTLVVATRTPHILILDGLLRRAGLEVEILTSEHSTKERDQVFAWLTEGPPRVLVSGIVKEGVSLPELKAGVVADVTVSADLARQIIGRFIRKKPDGDNHAHLAWFIDRTYKSARKGCLKLFDELQSIKGYNYYFPCHTPDQVGDLYKAANFD